MSHDPTLPLFPIPAPLPEWVRVARVLLAWRHLLDDRYMFDSAEWASLMARHASVVQALRESS